jgi:hypothetical protein
MAELDLDGLSLFARAFVLFGSVRVAVVIFGVDPRSECFGGVQVFLEIAESLGGGDGDWLVNGWRGIVSVKGCEGDREMGFTKDTLDDGRRFTHDFDRFPDEGLCHLQCVEWMREDD